MRTLALQHIVCEPPDVFADVLCELTAGLPREVGPGDFERWLYAIFATTPATAA